MAQNKFIFADRHGLICRSKSSSKDTAKPQEPVALRKTSAMVTSSEKVSLDNIYSTDNVLSSSLENLHQLISSEAAKKNESFFYGFFNDNHVGGLPQQKKSVTIMEPNGHKVYPVKSIKKDKICDGNKKILENQFKTENSLDLSTSNLSQLSRSISKLVHLTQLYIYGNKISKLPKEIGNLVNLKELWIQENNIDTLPVEMKSCKALEHLDIRHNHLGDESLMVLTCFPNLKILLITHNKFTRLDGIGQLKKLERLSVKGNKLDGPITRSIGKLNNMISLDLSKNMIVSIPCELGNCIKLERLNLEYNRITELPETIGNLKELEFIGIKYNQLENLPSTLSSCVRLKELNVESNNIEELPNDLVLNLHRTIKLNISHNKFTNLPKCPANEDSIIEKINAEYNYICRLSGALVDTKNLRILNLCYNNLSELQSIDIDNFYNLVDLNLAFNRLVELPSNIARLSHLESLDLTNNLLSTTPKEIGQLRNLKFLNLESNELTSLPEEFGQLEKLKNLNISSNKLKVFPMCIVQLRNLEMLNMSENLITELPKSINELNRLTHLFLKDNTKLNNLPVSLSGMRSLNFLSLNGCPLREIPVEYAKSPITVIAYLKAFEIGLRLHEYLKMSNDKLNSKPLFSSDTSLNVTSENSVSADVIMTTDDNHVLSRSTEPNYSAKHQIDIRPRSLSANAASKKEHIEQSINRKTAQQLTIPDSLIKKMQTTEAGFLACSMRDTAKKS